MWWAGLGQQLGLVQNSDYSHWQDTKTKACLTSEGGEMEKGRRKRKPPKCQYDAKKGKLCRKNVDMLKQWRECTCYDLSMLHSVLNQGKKINKH